MPLRILSLARRNTKRRMATMMYETGNDTPEKGDMGEPGTAGAQGPVGPQGPKGDTGATGPAGPTGATGSQGIQGTVGATGSQGPIGLTGATGPAGTNGNNGAINLGTKTVSETATTLAIQAGFRYITLTGVTGAAVGDTIVATPTSTLGIGYAIHDAVVTATGTVRLTISVPLITLLSSYSFTVKLMKL